MRISKYEVPLAAEDRFLIISIREALALCPDANDAQALGFAIDVARPFLGDLVPLFDLRGLPHIYNDVADFMDGVARRGSHVLVNPRTAHEIDIDYYSKARGLQVLSVKRHRYTAKSYDLSDLRQDHDEVGVPFSELSISIADEFTFNNVENASVLDDEGRSYDAPSLELLERALTPKRLRQLVLDRMPLS